MKSTLTQSAAIFSLILVASMGCTKPQQEVQPQAPASQKLSPAAELSELDTRLPVPLQPMMAWHQKQNMMEHLVVIQRITGALAEKDWAEISKASAIIGTSPEMKTMCENMGAGAPGFTELALEFHSRADAIGGAAQKQDVAAVLNATSNTLQACTSCHAKYRQDVVDSATWQERTASSAQ